jgi:hypothetical protein
VRRITIFFLAASVGFSVPLPFAAAGGDCDLILAATGCPNISGEIGGGGATLSGNQSKPGTPGGGSGGGPGSSGDQSKPGAPGGGSGGGPGSSGNSGSGTGPARPCEEVFAGYCYGEGQPKPGEGGAVSPGTPAVTLSDIAQFRPQPPTQRMQPDGWMIVGLDTNFYAPVERHVVSGTLLGAPADVRFTPVAYRWRYGDSTSARLTTKGATWQALGLREFDPTPTSHVYRASGTYVIELDVEYTAEYRFDGGTWIALRGIIVLPANRLVATAGDAVTVLVDRGCAQPPAGPGC